MPYVCHAHTSVHTHAFRRAEGLSSGILIPWEHTPFHTTLRGLAGCTPWQEIIGKPLQQVPEVQDFCVIAQRATRRCQQQGGLELRWRPRFLKADVCSSCSHRILQPLLLLTMSYVK